LIDDAGTPYWISRCVSSCIQVAYIKFTVIGRLTVRASNSKTSRSSSSCWISMKCLIRPAF
jgi:hypothetical protein